MSYTIINSALNLSIVFCYGYISAVFIAGFAATVVRGLPLEYTYTAYAPEVPEIANTVTVEVQPQIVAVPIKRSAAKSAPTTASLVIPVQSLEELKAEAKRLKIKGWNFYRDCDKLQAAIDAAK